jgi:hypothetical protein
VLPRPKEELRARLGRKEEPRAPTVQRSSSLVHTVVERGIRPLRARGEDCRRPALPAPVHDRDAVDASALGVTSGRRLAGGHGRDGAALPAVLMTMHAAWGFGFLAGSIRFGPPIAAVVRATGSGLDSGGARH